MSYSLKKQSLYIAIPLLLLSLIVCLAFIAATSPEWGLVFAIIEGSIFGKVISLVNKKSHEETSNESIPLAILLATIMLVSIIFIGKYTLVLISTTLFFLYLDIVFIEAEKSLSRYLKKRNT